MYLISAPPPLKNKWVTCFVENDFGLLTHTVSISPLQRNINCQQFFSTKSSFNCKINRKNEAGYTLQCWSTGISRRKQIIKTGGLGGTSKCNPENTCMHKSSSFLISTYKTKGKETAGREEAGRREGISQFKFIQERERAVVKWFILISSPSSKHTISTLTWDETVTRRGKATRCTNMYKLGPGVVAFNKNAVHAHVLIMVGC